MSRLKKREAITLLLNGHFSAFKTLYLNFKSLPFRYAIRFPLAVSRDVKIKGMPKHGVEISGEIKPFMILLGFGGSADMLSYRTRKSYLYVSENGRLKFSGKAQFAPHFSLYVRTSTLCIGKNFNCNNGCIISSVRGVSIGDDCLLGGDIVIRDSDGHKIYHLNSDGTKICEKENAKEVKIGNHVWICNKCDILKGVTIPSDCVVAYGSLCTKAIEGTNQIIAGTPASGKRGKITWEQ